MPRVIPLHPAGPGAQAARAHRLASLPPLSLYIHVPWCVRKCPYCDFNSHELRGELPEDDYLAALVADLECALPQVWGRPVHTVFIGGGTPSLLSPAGVDRLLAAVRARLPLVPDAEITLEANPGTVEASRFAGFRSAGVNRISLGIQSFDPHSLAALGRIHDDREARIATETALAHFENVNLDLMFALPGQRLDDVRRDLETAIGYRPAHLSAYQLTLEPNTAFHRREPPGLPEADLAADMQEAVAALLGQAGYERYEVSAYAPREARCRHNLNYWTFGDYLGIGAGAHAKISFPDRIAREARYRHPLDYMQRTRRGDPCQQRLDVAETDLPFEFMLNALRLVEGVPADLFPARTGLPLQVVEPVLRQARAKGLMHARSDRLVPTALGRSFLNDLLAMFLPDPAAEG